MYQSKAAVVGTGFIGPVHIEGLVRAGVRVQGVLGTSRDKSELVANRYGLPRAYSSFEELLQDRDVDVVHITSPNRFHFEQAVQCLEAGKHVLCEKPLAMTSAESAQLVMLAKASNCKTAVNYNVRFYPICIEASERIRSGDVGEIFHVTGSYVQDWLHESTDFNWRVLSSEGGPLRALADIGTHWLDLVQSVTGLRVVEVFAELQTVHSSRWTRIGSNETFTKSNATDKSALKEIPVDTEDYGSVLLRFENGAKGSMHVSQVTAGMKNCIRFEIAGSKKSLAWNSQTPDELWIGNRRSPNEQLLRDPSLLSERARSFAQYPGGHNEGFPDTFKQLFRAFYSRIELTDEGVVAYPTFEDGHREIVVCEAILESARSERWVKLSN